MPTSAEVAAYVSTLTGEMQATRDTITQLQRDSAAAQRLEDVAAAIEAGTPPQYRVKLDNRKHFVFRGQAALDIAATFRAEAAALWAAIVIPAPEPPA